MNQKELMRCVRKKYPLWASRGTMIIGRGICDAETMDCRMAGTILKRKNRALIVCDNGMVSGIYPITQFTITQRGS